MRILAVLALLLAVSSCGRSAPAAVAGHPGIPAFGLPAPSGLLRHASDGAGDSMALEQRGADLRGDITNLVVALQTTARFSPSFVGGSAPDGIAYAAYDFDLTGYAGAAEVSCFWVAPPASVPAYVALANWGADRWDWYDVAGSGVPVALPDMAPYTGPAGEAVAVVAVTGTVQVDLGLVRIGAGGIGPRWHMTQVATDSPCYRPNLVELDGLPAVVYGRKPASDDVYFALQRALDSHGETWAPPEMVYDPGGDNAFVQGVFTCMVAGRLCVFCTWSGTVDDGSLVFLRSTDSSATAFEAPTIIYSNLIEHVVLAAADVGGNPAYLFDDYFSDPDPQVDLARALDPAGTAWGPNVKVSVGGGVFEMGVNIVTVGGNPAVFSVNYGDFTTTTLNYRRSPDADGSTWPNPVGLISAPESAGLQMRGMVLANGFPAAIVGASPGATTDLEFFPAIDALGDSWPLLGSIVGSLDSTPFGSSDLTLEGGNPALAYRGEGLIPGLYYLAANDATGSTWNAPLQIDDRQIGTLDMLEIGGMPAIAATWVQGAASYPLLYAYY